MNNITLNTEEVYIKDIKPNDYILSYDIISKKNVPKKVLNIHRPIVNNKKQIQFNYEGGEIITSISHPTLVFRNKKYEYIEAGDVKKSDLLKGQNKDYNILKIIRHPNVDPNFIDLTIEDTNNYFAKENNSLNFIVMHNTNIS